MQAVETCVPPARLPSHSRICASKSMSISVSTFFARQNPHSYVLRMPTQFRPKCGTFCPHLVSRQRDTERDRLGRRTSPSSSWTSSLTASRSVLCTISLVELMVDRFFIPAPMSSPNGGAGFPAEGGRSSPAHRSSRAWCVVILRMKDGRAGAGVPVWWVVGRAGVRPSWIVLISDLRFHLRNELIVRLSSVMLNSAFNF